jgi:hypothetical protein
MVPVWSMLSTDEPRDTVYRPEGVTQRCAAES